MTMQTLFGCRCFASSTRRHSKGVFLWKRKRRKNLKFRNYRSGSDASNYLLIDCKARCLWQHLMTWQGRKRYILRVALINLKSACNRRLDAGAIDLALASRHDCSLNALDGRH